ncbi:MAG: FMN-binding protein [bacterium]
MKNFLNQTAPVLFSIICSILILTIADIQTKPLIAQTEDNTNLSKLKSVIKAVEFVPVLPETLWQAYDSLKNLEGIVFKVWTRAYAGVIPITAGVDVNGKITGIRIGGKREGFKETQGLGSKVRDAAFTNQFVGKEISHISLKSEGGEIDAITGATISSKAVCEGIKKGMERYRSVLNQGKIQDIKKEIFADARNFAEVIKDTLWYAIAYSDTLGIVFSGETFGYLDTIKYLLGLRKDGSIERIIITYSKETEGIGEQIREHEFLDKFKTGIPDAITGATISSCALIKSVQKNIKKFKDYLK